MTLVITIAIMLILITTVSVSGITVYNNYKKVKFATELAFIEQSVNTYYNHNGEYPVSDSLLVDISGLSSDAISEFSEEEIVEGKVKLYKIDKTLIGKNETAYGNGKTVDDIYAVSISTGNIYYIAGIKASGTTYYTLTDELRKIVNIDEIKDVKNVDNISFKKDYGEYTNNDINITIKIPDIYQDVNVSVYSNGVLTEANIQKTSNDGKGFNIYSKTITQNSDIIVIYTKDGVQKKQIFSVTNIDKVAPLFEIATPIKKVGEDGSVTCSIEILNLNDSLSGIKNIKYETEKIYEGQISTYFASNGHKLKEGELVITTKVTSGFVTIFVEDNAGNISYQYVEIK